MKDLRDLKATRQGTHEKGDWCRSSCFDPRFAALGLGLCKFVVEYRYMHDLGNAETLNVITCSPKRAASFSATRQGTHEKVSYKKGV